MSHSRLALYLSSVTLSYEPPHPTFKFAPANSMPSISSSVHDKGQNRLGSSVRSMTIPDPGSTLPSEWPE